MEQSYDTNDWAQTRCGKNQNKQRKVSKHAETFQKKKK